MKNDELDKAIKEAQSSSTLNHLAEMAQIVPIDINNKVELKKALITCLMGMLRGLDNDRIHFDEDGDAAVFYGLLSICLAIIADGKVKPEKTNIH